MKAFITVLILLALAVLFYVNWPKSRTPEPELTSPRLSAEPSVREIDSEPQGSVSEMGFVSGGVTPPVIEMPDSERQQRLEKTKAALELLMRDYDANLKNAEKRTQLQAQIDKLMDEYNELILPIALEKVKQEVPAGD